MIQEISGDGAEAFGRVRTALAVSFLFFLSLSSFFPLFVRNENGRRE